MKEFLMSQRQCIRDLEVNGEADSVFLLGGASLQQSRNGPYWRLELRDAGGAMEAKIWSPLSASFHDLSAGQLAHVRGRVGLFREQLQLTVEDLRVLTDEEAARVDLAEFMPASPRPVPDMMEELDAMIERELTHAPWKLFVRSVLEDERVRLRLPAAPAAKSVHHAYVGGLLEHMLSVAGLCLRMADHYPELDRQMLCAGALLHDIGKLEEMSGGLVNEYTDAGRFLGHIAQGLIMMEPHLAASGLEPALALHFRHLIASHHGEPEYGSPRQPATAEAFALHYADHTDAKLAQWRALFPPREASSPNGSGDAAGTPGGLEWSPWQSLLGRALCRVPRTPAASPVGNPDALPEGASAGNSLFCPDDPFAPCGDVRNCGSEDAGGTPAGTEASSGGAVRLSAPAAECARAAERPEEREEDAPGGAAEGAETESGGRKPGAVRRRRRTSDATAENGAAELPAMPGNAPGRAEGRPDRAREKDLTQCSLL